MSGKKALFLVLVLQAIFGANATVSSSAAALDVEHVQDNTDCTICLIPTAADEVCACQGVKGNKKGRDSCTLFFECSGGQDRQDLVVGEESNGCGGHYFHLACLRGWVERGGACPVCRKTFSPDERILLWRDLLYLTPSLSQAAVTGNILRVKKYLRRGFSVNVNDVVGFAPLHYASRYGQLAVVQELLTVVGVLVDMPDYLGNTPLYWAVYSGHKDIVRALIAAGAVLTQQHIDIAYEQGHWMLYWLLRMR